PPRRRSRRPSADAHGHRRQRHGGRADPRACSRRSQAGTHGRSGPHRGDVRMNALLAFPVALPLAGAGFIALTDDSTPEELKDIPAMLIAAATTTISTIILVRSE